MEQLDLQVSKKSTCSVPSPHLALSIPVHKSSLDSNIVAAHIRYMWIPPAPDMGRIWADTM